jgi:hypothetical protein
MLGYRLRNRFSLRDIGNGIGGWGGFVDRCEFHDGLRLYHVGLHGFQG